MHQLNETQFYSANAYNNNWFLSDKFYAREIYGMEFEYMFLRIFIGSSLLKVIIGSGNGTFT